MAVEGKHLKFGWLKRRLTNHMEINSYSYYTVHTAETVGLSPLIILPYFKHHNQIIDSFHYNII